MDAAAWIGFAGGVAAALVSAAVALRQQRMDKRLAQVQLDLDTELHRRTAAIDRDMRAEELLARYREPLASAAFDLQSRLYNILRLGFFERFGGEHPRSEEAMRTTLFRIAQYFGWSEILRRDVQFLSFADGDATRRVTALQLRISRGFLTDGHGPAMMIWADEQRALGERMIVEQQGRALCMGYATFGDHCAATFAPWLERVRAEVLEPAATERLRELQHLLCDLVELLDPAGVRFAAADLHRA